MAAQTGNLTHERGLLLPLFHDARVNPAILQAFVPGMREPVVEPAVFEAVQELIEVQRRSRPVQRAPAEYLLVGSILLGFAGVAVLSWPVLSHGATADVMGVVALLLAPLFWAIGSIWLQRRKPDLSVRAIADLQTKSVRSTAPTSSMAASRVSKYCSILM